MKLCIVLKIILFVLALEQETEMGIFHLVFITVLIQAFHILFISPVGSVHFLVVFAVWAETVNSNV